MLIKIPFFDNIGTNSELKAASFFCICKTNYEYRFWCHILKEITLWIIYVTKKTGILHMYMWKCIPDC